MEEHERARFLVAALMWSRAVGIQFDRLSNAQVAIGLRARGERLVSVDDESRAIFHAIQADRHFLVVAALNLVRALKQMGMTDSIPALDAEHVRHLRNCLEHWDKGTGPSFDEFERLVPGGDPQSHSWGPGGTLIGGVDFAAVARDVSAFRVELLKLEADGWAWKGAS